MMKNIITSLVFVLTLSFANTAHASLDITASVDVPSSCSATDTDGIVHDYPKGDSYLAICALEAALNNSSVSSAQLSNQYPSMGLFITTINGAAADPNSQYWALYQNGNYASLGLAMLPIVAGDSIMLQLHDFSDNNLGDQVTLNIHSLVSDVIPIPDPTPAPVSQHGGGSYIVAPAAPVPKSFSVSNAISYLKSIQDSAGSFGGSYLYTDWSAIALGPNDALLAYMNTHPTLGFSLTDNERHAMALLSLGVNPYSFNGVNYIKAITDTFDGTQFGDSSLVNDDIFALIPLQSAGYTASDEIISKDIKFILSKEQADGSWDESIDMTAAAIQTLKPFDSVSGVSDALTKAGAFISGAQGSDGGWKNVSSTSWAMQAMNALGASWTKNGKGGLDYLATQQMTDGAVSSSTDTLQNRIWATSYAIPAVLGKSWNQIMVKVAAVVEVPTKSDTNSAMAKSVSSKKITKANSVKNISKFNKLANIASQNVAASIVAVQNVPKPAQKRGWFMNFLGKIFGF